ncbi:hypothetical protein WN48_08727 [Eufriesea mexicana]|nr:hypothetical protein WN48_08727 [Eufriesea mexicana]
MFFPYLLSTILLGFAFLSAVQLENKLLSVLWCFIFVSINEAVLSIESPIFISPAPIASTVTLFPGAVSILFSIVAVFNISFLPSSLNLLYIITEFSMLRVFSKLSKFAQPVDSTGSDGTTSHGLTSGSAVLVDNGSIEFQAEVININAAM